MQLPIGVSDYRKLVETRNSLGEGYLYVDKSLLIKELLEDLTEVIVFTRPRRFGKTLNLSMLQYFFAAEVNGQATSGLFANQAIAEYPVCLQYQGKAPVIFLGLKDTKAETYESALKKIYEQISQLYSQHLYILETKKLTLKDRAAFKAILKETASIEKLAFSLANLSKYLYQTLGQKVYIFIDEYDTPIQEAYLKGYYEQFIAFMRTFLGSALKGNVYLKQAILTGILRVSKESLFSDLNNVKIYSVLNTKYASYFGFTDHEVQQLIKQAQLSDNAQQTKEWYNGYQFGRTTIYNPYSIVEFIAEQGRLQPYWVNTSGNALIRDLVLKAPPSIKEQFATLLAGGSVRALIDEHVVFGDLELEPEALWNFLLMSGYLTATLVPESEWSAEVGLEYALTIPNKELESLYKKILRQWCTGDRGLEWYQDLLRALTTGQVADFEAKLQTLSLEVFSYHDVKQNSQEAFYHGLMLGLLAGLKETHELKSNRESGRGRYDVLLVPKDRSQLGLVLEFKASEAEAQLEQEAQLALAQIQQSRYVTELQQRGITQICQMGIAFSRKDLKIVAAFSEVV